MSLVVRRLVVVILLCLPMAVFSMMRLNHDLLRKVVIHEDTLPKSIGDWKGTPGHMTEADLSMLDSPAASISDYMNSNGDSVQVMILQVNDSQNAHDPKLCMAGSGFSNPHDDAIQAPWAPPGQQRQISRAEFTKGDESDVMYYWLQTRSGTIASMSSGFKLEALKRAFAGSSIRGIAVRVLTLPNSRTNGQTDEKAARDLWQAISQKIGIDRLVSQID